MNTKQRRDLIASLVLCGALGAVGLFALWLHYVSGH
jgi:hypothetical protein